MAWRTFLWIFMRISQNMPLYFFYTMVQKVKNEQKLKWRGSFNHFPLLPNQMCYGHTISKKSCFLRFATLSSFLPRAIISWNALPAEVQSSKALLTFKNRLTAHLLTRFSFSSSFILHFFLLFTSPSISFCLCLFFLEFPVSVLLPPSPQDCSLDISNVLYFFCNPA